MIRNLIVSCAVLVLGIATASPASATDESGNVRSVEPRSEISWVSGGVGDQEQERLKEVAKDFNLRVTLANPAGEYLGGAHLEIRDRGGKTVLQAESEGPLFFAKLAPGSYTVKASEAGDAEQKTVEVGSGTQTAVLFHLEKGAVHATR
jgi:hypothetical protein